MSNQTKRLLGGRFQGLLISIFLAVSVLLDLILPGCGTEFEQSLWSAAFSGGLGSLSAACFALFILLAISIVTEITGVCLVVFKKSLPLSSFGTLLACCLIMLLLNASFGIYGIFGLILLLLKLILILAGTICCTLCLLWKPAKKKSGKSAGSSRPAIQLFGVLSLIVTLLLFLVPFCRYANLADVDPDAAVFPLSVLFGGWSRIEGIVIFSLLIVFVIADFILFLRALEDSSGQDSIFAGKMKRVITLSSFITGGYFVCSVLFCTLFGKSAAPTPIAILPFLCMAGTAVGYAFLLRKVNRDIPESRNPSEGFSARVEFFLYGMLLTLLTVGASLTDIVKVTVKEPETVDLLTLNGLNILRSFNEDGGGFRMAAFLLLTVLTVTLTLFLASLVSLIGKSALFHKITLTSCLCGAASCMLIGLFGKYYEVVQEINEQTVLSMVQNYVGTVNIGFVYSVKSMSYLWFLAAMAVVLILLIRRPYSRLLGQHTPGFADGVSGGAGAIPEAGEPVDSTRSVDPCPAFTELDRKAELFARQAREAAEFGFESPSLQSLTQFVVNYARDSRLHLSYRAEDIAAFIAGLGTSRLTILQGMSGTGKTSLPKIFAEAVLGNCEIIEVESSWRDKHELLGYYNEFSKTYTPKKFTQALYRARLNPNRLTFIVLDEMNLSRIEYYFSDFLSLMENEEDKREIKLLNVGLCRVAEGKKIAYRGLTEGHTLKIPPNVWFIGTANRDESTFEISDKVYDRAHTLNFNKRAPKVTSYRDPIPQRWISAEQFAELLRQADRSGHFDLESCDVIYALEELLAPYNISFGNRVARQIETFVRIYCACFPPSERVQNEAVETILLSKVVSKLEYRSVENKEQLAAELRRLKLDRCSEFVLRLNED